MQLGGALARVVAVDSGHFMGWPPMYLSVPDTAGFVFTAIIAQAKAALPKAA